MSNNKTLIIIPAYNEEESLGKVVEMLQNNYPKYDYVIINDGSRDNTLNICKKNGYNVIAHPINLGLQSAIVTGMKYAYRNGYDYAIQFDADGQHLPEYIEQLENKIIEGYDIVIGSRFVTGKKPFSLRMMGSDVIAAAIRLSTRTKLTDPTSGMRIYSRRCMEKFATDINYGPEPDTISYLIKNGFNVAEVQVMMKEREAGDSYLTIGRSIKYMVQMLVSILIIQNFRKKV